MLLHIGVGDANAAIETPINSDVKTQIIIFNIINKIVGNELNRNNIQKIS